MEKSPTIQDKINIIQSKIQVEKDPTTKQELNKQLKKLQLNKEIENIRKRIEQLG